ncbi:MAG TPA: discoidin domain-containing protein [Sedimentisphaerales bacterium]|nr:discoidin domain-containing protein [Sedimentisphaerales bacterium]
MAVTPITAYTDTLYAPVPAITPNQIETDWLRQDEVRWSGPIPPSAEVKPEEDAPGGCDGIISGGPGFHTGKEDRPWWQVDLGEVVSLSRVVVHNGHQLAEPVLRLMLLVSEDGRDPWQVYEHEGTPFLPLASGGPVVMDVEGMRGRYVRVQLAGKGCLYLEEVEVYAASDGRNVALGKPATQSSSSERSTFSVNCGVHRIRRLIGRGLKLGENLRELGAEVDEQLGTLRQIAGQIGNPVEGDVEQARRQMYLCAHRAVRQMALGNPLLDFDKILFVKRAAGTLPHMSDQYYGWWSRPGGGIYLLEGFKSERPLIRCLTEGWAAGNFLRPELSYDGKKVLFAYCRYHAHVAGMEKVDKEELPEDAFYHIFEMNIDGTGCRQLTYGRYDDFDGRYLPNGDIVFLSTRKGQSIQCGKDSAAATKRRTLPDSYVRCGGDEKQPVAVFTLHAMNPDGSHLRPISAFENFEWTPSVADDGRILYARWDYIDRFNGHYMSLWSTNQDGTNPQLVYGNFTRRPQCVFEARSIPNSHKLVFTASAHHSITGGSLALLDRTLGTEGEGPITRPYARGVLSGS